MISDKYEKEIKEILAKERWQGYISGKIEGAINVLNLLEIDNDKKIEILSETAGLSHMTATEMLENS